MLGQSNKELGLLGLTFSAIHSDGLSSDALEFGVLVSADLLSLSFTYLTRFSAAITLMDTALPRACISIVSWA